MDDSQETNPTPEVATQEVKAVPVQKKAGFIRRNKNFLITIMCLVFFTLLVIAALAIRSPFQINTANQAKQETPSEVKTEDINELVDQAQETVQKKSSPTPSASTSRIPTKLISSIPTKQPTTIPSVAPTKAVQSNKTIQLSVNARLYDDMNCNGEKEGSETYVTASTTMSLWKMPEYNLYGQSSSPDSNGYYVITATIPENDSIVFQVSPNPVPPGYKSSLGETLPQVTMDKNNTFKSVEIGVLPYANYSACQ